ncbi:hypothetical protein KCP78_23025 [Salmonella enterica subsp. enterica]|nr:hypothetical protein KCP78_23025 [Salmonella enterica subsp. enterica]
MMNHAVAFPFQNIIPLNLADKLPAAAVCFTRYLSMKETTGPLMRCTAHHLSALVERSDQYRYQNGMCHLNVQPSSHGLTPQHCDISRSAGAVTLRCLKACTAG